MDAGECEAWAAALNLDPNPDLAVSWHSGQTPPVGLNPAFYRNPEVDALLDRLKTTFDREETRALLARVQPLIHEDEPVTFLNVPLMKWGISSRLTNVRTSPIRPLPVLAGGGRLADERDHGPDLVGSSPHRQVTSPCVVRFALNRSVSAVLTLLGVLALVFGLVTAAPGDAAALAARAGGNRAVAVSPEALAAFRHLYGLDRPVVERFVTWIWRAARLDFGRSLVDGQPVTLRVARALPATFALNTAALLLACLIGVPLGIAGARRPGGRLDRVSGFVCDAFFATPTFVLGLVLLLVFSGWLRITPLFADAESGVRGFLLPVATLSLASLALVARFVRVCVAAALADPAALAGRARGERPSEEIRRALRRSAAAFAAMGAVLVPSVVSGSILVERVFSLPGAGGLLAEAVFARDLPTVLALTWCSALVVVAASLVADLVTAALDPRIAREVEVTVPGVAA